MVNPDYQKLAVRLGVGFTDLANLKRACLHRSYLNEHPDTNLEHNERLEFLGDAVLELAVTNHLFGRYPDKNEGELTAYRAALVNAESLAACAVALGVNDFLLLSRGEAKDTGRARQAILANALEAIIAAIFLDQGYSAAEQFILRHLLTDTEERMRQFIQQDAKSLFQVTAQEKRGVTPEYHLLSESGPDHDKQFEVGLYLGEELVTVGRGSSKQRAEQQAASAGLRKFNWSH